MDKLPLDARLLSNAVIELNSARHILSLYSREHQLVQLSLDKTFAILTDLFELRPEITLAVAQDTLVIDGRHLDQKNPVYREFALALSRMSVALVSFVKGVTREEVYDFFRFLSQDAAGISSETLPHILIESLDYRLERSITARFARTGIELPGGGLNVDDVLLSPEVASLFKEDEGRRHGLESCQAEIGRVVDAQTDVVSSPDHWELAHELDEGYIRYCHANALFALLDCSLPGLITLEDEDAYAAAFTALAKHSVGTGQYAQLLELLTRFEDLERRGLHQSTVRTVREYCREAEFVAGLADSFRLHGRADRAGAAMVCAFYGRAIVPPLFDLLAVEKRLHVRRMLLQLLIGLGEHAVREAPLRLQDQRWHVRRNTLFLLAESGAQFDPGLLEPLSKDSDPRVRLECARCLVLAGEAAGVPTLRALLHNAGDDMADAAVAMAGALGVKELLPDLVELIRKPAARDGIRQRLRVVRALGQLGGDQAAAALRELLALRISLFPGETNRFRSEVRRMLKRIAGKQPPGEAGRHGVKFVRLPGAEEISRLDFLQGASAEEIPRGFADVAATKDPPGRSAHIRLERAAADAALSDTDPGLVDAAFHAEQLARVQTVYGLVSPFRELPVGGLEDVVSTFLLAFRRGTNLLRLLSPVKTHNEHTCTHAINVSVLALALAENLGLKDESVQAIGIGALLHDVGKLLIPKEIALHPFYGAAYLARVEGLTKLAVLVALEHHRKYDTSGYPVLRDNGRRQHAASQIVAIADFYDTLRSHRPYRRSLSISEVLGIMQKDAGSGFNPGLLRRFTVLMAQAAAAA